MGSWLVVAGGACARALEEHVHELDATARVRIELDPWRARELLRGSCAGWAALVGEGLEGPSAVNLAAALAADGRASEVILSVGHASGSLRSRAKRAGISRVLSADEMAARPKSNLLAKGASPSDGAGRVAGGSSVDAGAGGRGSGAPRAGAGAPMRADRLQAARPPASSAPCGESGPGTRVSDHGVPARSAAVRRGGVPVVCFVSGRGGVGKTTACALAGHIAAAWGMSVAMLDLDLGFGNLAAVCGADRVPDLAQVARGDADDLGSIDACGRQLGSGVGVWGPCAMPEHAELVYPHVERIVERLAQTHDIVLVDTTTNWCDAVACAVQMADRLVIVSDNRSGAVPALVRCGALAVRLGVARTRIVRLMNGCDPKGRDMAFVTRAAQGLECARELRVLDGGEEAIELLAAGHVANLVQVDNPLALSLATGLAQLLRELGRLPECELAAKALEGGAKARRLFGKRKEVA